MDKLFQKKEEDFVCEHCGCEVKGNGYTSHCPKCLWSKHVDINPGDRECKCCGMMRPIRVEVERGQYLLTHRCEKCGYLRRKKVEKNDNFDEVIKLSRSLANG